MSPCDTIDFSQWNAFYGLFSIPASDPRLVVCYPVNGILHISGPLMVFSESSLCGDSGFS